MSLPASAAQICEWTGGELISGRPDQIFQQTHIDSRQAGPGALFVAIVGENHDAHRFIPQVLDASAAGILISSASPALSAEHQDAFVVLVPDTTKALAELAHGHRQSFEGPLIGITGSNGKTTAKELCFGILSRKFPTLATTGNLNNHFGLPLTLLRREAADQAAVIEMGMNHRGEIAALAAIAQPTIGVLTNVGSAHIEFLGSRENIATEKGDLLAAIPASGTVVLGRDEPLAFRQAERSVARVLSFGQKVEADLHASSVRFVDASAFAFQLETPFGKGELRVPGLSPTIVESALAAAGGAFAAGATFEEVANGLAAHTGVPGRMQPHLLPGDILVIDDSYNANPQSMKNALETLAQIDRPGRRYAVLGQMGELGDQADAAHREAGRLAASLGIDELFALGDSADLVAEGARMAGMPTGRSVVATSHEEIARTLRGRLAKGDSLLIKGSRAATMERVLAALETEENRG